MSRIDDIDWNQLPQSNWTIQTTLSFDAVHTIAGLNRHLDRIQRMGQLVQEDIEALSREWEAAPNQLAIEHGFDPITEEMIWDHEIDRGMYALLAVAISARVETWLFNLCDNRGIECRTKKKKTNLDLARNNLRAAGIDHDNLNGFDSYEKAAMLGHKFKHNGGLADAEVFEKYGIPEGQEIEYENEEWSTAIKGVSTYLDELGEHFRD